MASLIYGFEYDIFISYRQKDNKYDGWVTEFVDNLKKELEATFKENISVYFDINPHDGLLETHSVDLSLEDKLKCLIFIPIISRTYCDPNSFAWQNEFCVFNKQAKEDQFGRDIRLAGGNVASRILPVKINDLDPEDKTLLENELGGVLRAIEFIHRASGVNRPLTSQDDQIRESGKVFYRDQVNKVANAVKEIMTALKKNDQADEEIQMESTKTKPIPGKGRNTKIITGSFILFFLIALGIFIFPEIFESSEPIEKSVAVLPFRNDSPDQENAQFTNGTMEAILDNLCKIKDLRVISRTSVEQYRNTTRSIPQIAKDLDVSYVIEGSGQKYGDDIKLTVQLIDAVNDKHIWSNTYKRKFNDIFKIQSEIAQTIAAEIKAFITPEEVQLIEKVPTSNLSAYDLYLKANEYQKKYKITYDLNSYQSAVSLYRISLEMDSTFAKAYLGLARAYSDRYYWSEFFKETFLDSALILVNKALSIDDKLDEAYYMKGLYYWQNGNIEKAMENIEKTLIINPNFYSAYIARGHLLSMVSSDYVQVLENFHKALILVSGEERPSLLRIIGNTYSNLGFIEKAKYYYKEAFELDGNQVSYLERLCWLEFNLENYEESLRLVKKRNEIDSTAWLFNLHFYLYPPGHDDEAFIHAKKIIERYNEYGVPEYNQMHRIGYIFYKMGKYKEADEYFKQQIRYVEESIRLGRFYSQNKNAHYDIAATYAFLGNKEKAYQNLDEFNTMNFYTLGLISFVKNDPLFASIRHEERFQKILQNMESKYQAEHERVKKWLFEKGEF